jgi:hypothetical protein
LSRTLVALGLVVAAAAAAGVLISRQLRAQYEREVLSVEEWEARGAPRPPDGAQPPDGPDLPAN